ncbi:MAG TPA: NADPH:quinone oxidoreductase family protein [Galbitalea sp.]|jgi:NADPH2:quinone reductase|nr:NADPH:quinone oxidoreductase family protein [Galbitalea sp.]
MTMKAWQVERLGEPREVMNLVDAEIPVVAPDEVLVKARAVAINFPDVLLARGEYQVKPELPFTPGLELCGTVIEVGSEVANVTVGSRVVGSKIGLLSEYSVLAGSAVFPAPEALSDVEASALFIGYQTGYFGLYRRAALQPGETLLVHAAAGGVGTAAVQLGKAMGARVVGVVGSAAKIEVATKAGADVVIDRSVDDFVTIVNDLTDGNGADVIYDPVGGDVFERSTKCIAFEGRIVVVGFASGTIGAAKLNHALVKNYGILGLHWGLYTTRAPELVAEVHAELTRLAQAGAIRPIIGEVFPFAKAAEAVQKVATGTTVGRSVVTIA